MVYSLLFLQMVKSDQNNKLHDIQVYQQLLSLQNISSKLLELDDNWQAQCYRNAYNNNKMLCNAILDDPNATEYSQAAKRIMTLRFEECFINQTNYKNYINDYPWSTDDASKTKQMNDHLYIIYNYIQKYVNDLCYFSYQITYNQEITRRIINISKAIQESQESLNKTSIDLNNFYSCLNETIKELVFISNESSKNSKIFFKSFEEFTSNFTEIGKIMESTKNQISDLNFFLCVVLAAIFFGFTESKITLGILLLMLLEFYIEYLIKKKWRNSFLNVYQSYFRLLFVLITFFKPLLLIIDQIHSFHKEIKSKRQKNEQNYHFGIRASPPPRHSKKIYPRVC